MHFWTGCVRRQMITITLRRPLLLFANKMPIHDRHQTQSLVGLGVGLGCCRVLAPCCRQLTRFWRNAIAPLPYHRAAHPLRKAHISTLVGEAERQQARARERTQWLWMCVCVERDKPRTLPVTITTNRCPVHSRPFSIPSTLSRSQPEGGWQKKSGTLKKKVGFFVQP